MPKARQKPVEIEYVQFDGTVGSYTEIHHWSNKTVVWPEHRNPVVRTLECDMTVSPGDYVIRGVQGEFYPCKPDIFESTYDKVNDYNDHEPLE